jgi:PqqD family protein of HPr-rel-A system
VAEPRYAAPPAECLISVPLDGITALYHRSSAMTHIIAEPAPEILAALAAAPLTAAELLRDLGLGEDDQIRAALTARLDELEAGGLVSRQ